MKALSISQITKAEDIIISDVPTPEVKPGWVLVKVKAFGVNHSEQILRLEEIEEPYIKKPVIPGIECFGEIVDGSDTHLQKGDRVCALMGGMGRTFDGSYAEYALLPIHHTFKINTSLDDISAAAVPETYFTAWGSLFECLNLNTKDTLLIRGATCALGYVAIQIAKALGVKVIATTHRDSKLVLLDNYHVDQAVLDDGHLTGKVSGITKALDLVGPSVLRDTLTAVDKGAIVCHTGILGGVYTLDGFDPIKEIPNGVYLTGFFSNYPDQQTMQAIYSFIDEHHLKPIIGEVRDFKDLKETMYDLDHNRINGKLVIKVEG